MSEAQGVNSVEVAIAILDVISEFDEPVRATDIARVSGLSKSRLHKYLVSLCRSNMLYQNPETNLYSLSNKVAKLAAAVEKQNGVIARVNNALCQLTSRINISTGFAVKKGDSVHLIHYNRSNKNIDIDYLQNVTLPLTHSAAGKIYLSFFDGYQELNLLEPQEKQRIRERGYSIRRHKTEGIPGARSIACPVFNHQNSLIGSAVVMGFLPEQEEELHKIAVTLIDAIRELKLGVKPDSAVG